MHNSFTDETPPAATLFTGGTLSRPLYNIAINNDGTISFSYIDAALTGIGQVQNESTTDAAVYDLQGRRYATLQQAPAGIYVVGGKKVIK